MLHRIVPIALVVSAALACACGAKTSPVAPSATASATAASQSAAALSLVVRVVTRGAEAPIAGAQVFENDRLVGTTGQDGIVDATVTSGVEFHITVSAPGYDGNGAWGTVTSQERWTFYLDPQ